MRRLVIASVLLALSACDGADAPTAVRPSAAEVSAGSVLAVGAPGCLHFAESGATTLGPVLHEGSWYLGAQAGAFAVGGYDGTMYSIVTSPLVPNGAQGRGATHLTLRHVFQSAAGSFWTDDRAVCAPAGAGPAVCRINDQLEIVGGTGVFANASGRFHNLATADFAAMTLTYDSRGRVCGDGL